MVFREGRLVAVLISMADTLVSDFDVVDLFHELVVSCTDLLNVTQAGLLLTDGNGALGVAAASHEAAHVLEVLELENEGGPGKEAFRTGRPVRSGPLDGTEAQETWPTFAKAAHTAGFNGVVAVPMRLRDEVLGALNLFMTQEDALSEDDLTVAKALADLATIAIIQDRSTTDDRTLILQLETALDSRVVIEQAKGIVAQDLGLEMDAAFSRIRRYARDSNQRLRSVAAQIVSGEMAATELSPGD